MASKKGYITFLLMLQWAYLLLVPYLLMPSQPSSLTGAYAASRTQFENIALKRALVDSAQEAFDEVKTQTKVAEFLENILTLTGTSISNKAFGKMLPYEQEKAVQLAIIQKWSALLENWQKNSDFDVGIECTSTGAPYSISKPSASSDIVSLLGRCSDFISWEDDVAKLKQQIIITSYHRPSGTIASSELGERELNP